VSNAGNTREREIEWDRVCVRMCAKRRERERERERVIVCQIKRAHIHKQASEGAREKKRM